MSHVLEMTCSDAVARVRGGGRVMPLDPSAYECDRPDVHLALIDDHEMPAARLSLWTTRTPSLPNHQPGLIGHYAAANRDSGLELLREACGRLAADGKTLAIGPIDGDTSHRYRFITQRGSEPAFLLEPDNDDAWPDHFTAAGFHTLATYRSSVTDDLARIDDRVAGARTRLRDERVAIRPLRLDAFDADLRAIFDLSNAAFSRAFLHTPLDWPGFAAMYEPLRTRIDPRLVLIAEHDSRPVGFLFAVPDLHQAGRGIATDTVIIKTIAVLPDRALAGLGGVLMSDAHQTARQLGYRRAIHALMHEANSAIINLSSRYARPIRRYTLFARSLRP
jgi:GNAT superfamily N-acetyltransferase